MSSDLIKPNKENIQKLKLIRNEWKEFPISILMDAIEHCDGISKKEIIKYVVEKYGHVCKG